MSLCKNSFCEKLLEKETPSQNNEYVIHKALVTIEDISIILSNLSITVHFVVRKLASQIQSELKIILKK
jgi:hypothetical protein